MNVKVTALLIKTGIGLFSYLIEHQPSRSSKEKTAPIESKTKSIQLAAAPPEVHYGVSTEETIAYQKRELSKELLLLEKHLQQHCKINGTACDCCQKHPMAIEALSQEALGMTGDPVYAETAEWTKSVSPMTTAQASASGNYEDKYPKLAVEARELRKRIMGTTDVLPLLEPKDQEKLNEVLNG